MSLPLPELRVGRITRVEANEAARKPAWKLWIDFGDEGTMQSSAQITDLYTEADLLNRLVVAVMNLEPRRVAGFRSDVLVLGVTDDAGRIVLLQPDRDVPLGSLVH